MTNHRTLIPVLRQAFQRMLAGDHDAARELVDSIVTGKNGSNAQVLASARTIIDQAQAHSTRRSLGLEPEAFVVNP